MPRLKRWHEGATWDFGVLSIQSPHGNSGEGSEAVSVSAQYSLKVVFWVFQHIV